MFWKGFLLRKIRRIRIIRDTTYYVLNNDGGDGRRRRSSESSQVKLDLVIGWSSLDKWVDVNIAVVIDVWLANLTQQGLH